MCYRDGEGNREPLGMCYYSISIWDVLELESAWSRKNRSYFENNFPIFLLSSNSNTSIFKVCDVLDWVYFLVIKDFYNIFHSTFYWAWQVLCKYDLCPIYLLLLVTLLVTLLLATFFTLRVSLLLSSSNDASVDIVDDEDFLNFSSKAEFTSPLYVHITLVPKHHLRISHSCYTLVICFN